MNYPYRFSLRAIAWASLAATLLHRRREPRRRHAAQRAKHGSRKRRNGRPIGTIHGNSRPLWGWWTPISESYGIVLRR
jgi:hypothetical protein